MSDAQFPEKLAVLFEPYRYKVAHGGRGSAKSWSFARALLILAASKPLRILCAREVQKSIKDSVHTLLADQVQALGLGGFYEPLLTEIRGRNGSKFIFSGLSDQTAESIKSFEGVDIVWVEEAQSVSKRSWDILIPTIRKEGSEIWVSLNPELDTDETYTRFIGTPPPNSVVVEMNYTDNPWFPAVLEAERQHAKATMLEDDYRNIWEGKCRRAVSGAIYAGEISKAVAEGRVCNVPYDPRLKVHAVWDLGWNDSMSIILAQKSRSEVRIIEYLEDSHKTLDWYAAELNKRPYNWGKDWLPHDGFTKEFRTGKSAAEILDAFGRKVAKTAGANGFQTAIPQIGVEQGIRTTRMTFPQLVFNQAATVRLVEAAKRYRRGIPVTTGEPGAPVHDEWSHPMDALRYLSLVADKLSNEDDGRPKAQPEDKKALPPIGGGGWMR